MVITNFYGRKAASLFLIFCGLVVISTDAFHIQANNVISTPHANRSFTEIRIPMKPNELFSWGSLIGKGIQVVGSVLGVLHKTSSDHHTDDNFKNVFLSLDRNFQTITSSEEAIDMMITKSLDAVGDLQQDLNQSTAEILSDIDKVSQNVDRNFGYLLKVFKIASETYTAVEKTRIEMREEFIQVLEYVRSSRIAPTITKLNNFITYFADEKARISQLSREDRIASLLENDGFLQHLRESRTPTGDSLQSFMYEVIQQRYAIPQSANDKTALAALSSLYYGVQTQISLMRYLIRMNIYLADDSYRSRNIDQYNHHMENVAKDFKSFSDTLIGAKSLIDQVKSILEEVANLVFIGNNTTPSRESLLERVKNLEKEQQNLKDVKLPIIEEIPGKLVTHFRFDQRSPSTPIGAWKTGAVVSYAIQYRNADDLYSKVGEWSDPFPIEGKANPLLKVPAHSTHTRVIFRRFNKNRPQFVGILQSGSQSEFWDVDRDLYNAAGGSDESTAIQEAATWIGYGANPKSAFDLNRTALHAAAMAGNTEFALKLLLKDSDLIHSRDTNGYTPLHVAADGGWDDFVNLMVDQGADVNARTKSGSTPLHLAIANGYPAAVGVLLKTKDIDINAQDNYGAGPIHKAVINGVEDVLHTLLSDKRTNLNLKANGNITALHLSGVLENPETSRILLNIHGTKINTRSDGNMTALHLAIINGNLPVVQQLISLDGTDVNSRSVGGWTPLHYAVALKRKEEILELLKHDSIIVDVAGARKVTSLHIAAATGDIDAVESLMACGADYELQTADGQTALHLAIINHQEKIVSLILKKGADINSRTLNGSTILHMVAAQGNVALLNYVLELQNNIIVSPRNNEMDTPLTVAQRNKQVANVNVLKQKIGNITEEQLMSAASNGQLDVVKSLISRGSYVDSQVTRDVAGWSALEMAVGFGRQDVVKYLVEHGGADVDIKRSDGVGILHQAAWCGVMQMVQYVVEVVTDINARDIRGQTALAYASSQNHPDVVEFLKSKGVVP